MPRTPREFASNNPWQRRVSSRVAAVVTALLCVTLFGLQPASAQDQGFRVGLVVVTTLGVSPDEAESISARMAEALEKQLLVQTELGTRENLAGSVAESCPTNRPCIARVGAALKARELLFLAIVRIGERLQINVTWADVATGVTEPRDPVRVDARDDEQQVLLQAATRLIPNAQRRPEPTPTVPDKKDDTPTGTMATPSDTPPMIGAPAGGTSMPPSFTEPVDRVSGRHMTTGVWLLGGVSVLAAIGGSTFGALALNTSRQLDEDGCFQSACAEDPARVRSLRRHIDLADGLFATALVAGVAAGVLYWRSGPAKDRRVAVSPTVHGLQLSVSGSF